MSTHFHDSEERGIAMVFSRVSEDFRNVFDVHRVMVPQTRYDRPNEVDVFETRGTLVVADLERMQMAFIRTLFHIFRQWKNHPIAAFRPLTITFQYASNHRVIGSVKHLPGMNHETLQFDFTGNNTNPRLTGLNGRSTAFNRLVYHLKELYPLRTLTVKLHWGPDRHVDGGGRVIRPPNTSYYHHNTVVNANSYDHGITRRPPNSYYHHNTVVNANSYDHGITRRPPNSYYHHNTVVNANSYDHGITRRPPNSYYYPNVVVNANTYRHPHQNIYEQRSVSIDPIIQPTIRNPNAPVSTTTPPSSSTRVNDTFVRNANGALERNAISLNPIPRRYLWRAVTRTRNGVETTTAHDARAMAGLVDFHTGSNHRHESAIVTNPITRARLTVANIRDIMKIAGAERL
jgi:hypothetical protein